MNSLIIDFDDEPKNERINIKSSQTEPKKISFIIDEQSNDFYKIKLQPGTKKPLYCWKSCDAWSKSHINGNYGILTGKKNNLWVLDVDKDGINKWLDVKSLYNINSYTIKSPNGYHIYFKLPKDDDKLYIIDNYLKTTVKIGGYDWDIRYEGAYIVGPGSSVGGIKYDVFNNIPIIELPDDLINFLITVQPKKVIRPIEKQTEHERDFEPQYCYIINDDKKKYILEQLPNIYLNNYDEWLKVLTVFKSLGDFKTFDDWSKNSKHYNANENFNLYNSNRCNIDINYLIHIINRQRPKDQKIDKIESYKPLKSLIDKNSINNITIKNIVNNKVSDEKDDIIFFKDSNNILSFLDFLSYETIIIKSGTATGKTTAITLLFKRLKEISPDIKIITIVNKITLASQHVQSFKDVDINMLNYEDIKTDYEAFINPDALTICINSLDKLKIDDPSKYIIYIDEVSSLLNLTDNDTLKHIDFKSINRKLLKLIKYGYKVVLSDAFIKDGVYELLKSRNNKWLFLNNDFKHYDGVPAQRCRDFNNFKKLMSSDLEVNNYFFCACDSKNNAKSIYDYLIKTNPDRVNDIIIITSDETASGFRIKNANEQFINKFVIYSPSIVEAVSFSINEHQNVYIWIDGASIDASQCFQQVCRTRQIKKLFYYSELKTPSKEYKYNCLEDVKKEIRNTIDIITKECPLYNQCIIDNEFDELELKENTFFNLYCYNRYFLDAISTNIRAHFENFLLDAGFKLIDYNGDIKPISIDDRKEIKQIKQDHIDELLNEFLKADENEILKPKFKIILDKIDYLKIPNDIEAILEYKDEITNRYKLEDHDRIIKFLKSDDHINEKLKKQINETEKEQGYNSTISKINLLRQIQKKYNFDKYNIDSKTDKAIILDSNTWQALQTVYRIRREKPQTENELIKMIVMMIKNITTEDIIITKVKKIKGKNIRNYEWNNELIKRHLTLNQFKNNTMKDYDIEAVNFFNIIGTVKQEQDDDDDPFNDN